MEGTVTARRLAAGRILARIIGSVLALPALAALVGGLALFGAYAFARDDDGYFSASLDRIVTPAAAVTAEDIDLDLGLGAPGWVVDWWETDVRFVGSGGAVAGECVEDLVCAGL